jgi:hypothetical protein
MAMGGAIVRRPVGSVWVSATSRRETSLGEKQEAKRRRRENREERERDKASRTGDSPAQQAEGVRRRNAPDPEEVARRAGTDGSVGGDTAEGRPSQ